VKVVLREDVETLGRKGDLLDVADGYARNYLVPRGLAIKATKGVVAQADAVVVADHGRALAVPRPVAAGRVPVAQGEGAAVRLRARQDIVHVGGVATAVDGLALLGQRRLLAQLALGSVQVGHAPGDDGAFGVAPRALADAVACVDGCGTAGAEIGTPGAGAGARSLGQLLAMPVGAVEPAEIRALARAGARDEECHGALLRRGAAGHADAGQHR